MQWIIPSNQLEVECHDEGECREGQSTEEIGNVSRGEQSDLEQGQVQRWIPGPSLDRYENSKAENATPHHRLVCVVRQATKGETQEQESNGDRECYGSCCIKLLSDCWPRNLLESLS